MPGFGIPDTVAAPPATYAGWRSRSILGTDSPGGLLLSPAMPTAAHLCAPRAAWTDGRVVIAADAWHHRLLVWDELPTVTGTPQDHVLGQPDATSVQPNAGGAPGATTFCWPFGIGVVDGHAVADSGNNRVVIRERS